MALSGLVREATEQAIGAGAEKQLPCKTIGWLKVLTANDLVGVHPMKTVRMDQ